jgi:hypothetical protein
MQKNRARIMTLVAAATVESDWIDEDGEPYLTWKGASKVASMLGISFVNLEESEIINGTNLNGTYKIVTYKSTVRWLGREMDVIGTGNTQDDFFKINNKFIPASEVDLTLLKKKAITNMYGRGVKAITGIDFTWETLRIAPKVRTRAPEIAPTTDTAVVDARSLLKGYVSKVAARMNKTSQEVLMSLTTFRGKDGKSIPGKKEVEELTDKQISFLIDKLKKGKQK